MKLVVIDQVQQKINYLLNRFSIEWSGPAWFSVKSDKNGFPKTWKLEHFLPLNLGSHSSTEWEGKQFLKKSKKLYKRHPELKEMYMGNIHSHHTMGAFFSATDKEHLQESANLVGYPSLVVASDKDSHAFAISYLDSWKVKHIIDCQNIEVETNMVPDNAWINEADSIEKQSNKHKSTNAANQVTIWGPNNHDQRDNYYRREYGLSHEDCYPLSWEEKNVARRIVESGNIPIVKDNKVYLQPAEEKIMSGLVDVETEKQLKDAKSPKERYEIALEAFENGFMDDSAFQKEIELLYSKMSKDSAEKVIKEVDSIDYGGNLGYH